MDGAGTLSDEPDEENRSGDERARSRLIEAWTPVEERRDARLDVGTTERESRERDMTLRPGQRHERLRDALRVPELTGGLGIGRHLVGAPEHLLEPASDPGVDPYPSETLRSMKLRSSRTLPGHAREASDASISLGIRSLSVA